MKTTNGAERFDQRYHQKFSCSEHVLIVIVLKNFDTGSRRTRESYDVSIRPFEQRKRLERKNTSVRYHCCSLQIRCFRWKRRILISPTRAVLNDTCGISAPIVLDVTIAHTLPNRTRNVVFSRHCSSDSIDFLNPYGPAAKPDAVLEDTSRRLLRENDAVRARRRVPSSRTYVAHKPPQRTARAYNKQHVRMCYTSTRERTIPHQEYYYRASRAAPPPRKQNAGKKRRSCKRARGETTTTTTTTAGGGPPV